jgi:hypothetical protein
LRNLLFPSSPLSSDNGVDAWVWEPLIQAPLSPALWSLPLTSLSAFDGALPQVGRFISEQSDGTLFLEMSFLQLTVAWIAVWRQHRLNLFSFKQSLSNTWDNVFVSPFPPQFLTWEWISIILSISSSTACSLIPLAACISPHWMYFSLSNFL